VSRGLSISNISVNRSCLQLARRRRGGLSAFSRLFTGARKALPAQPFPSTRRPGRAPRPPTSSLANRDRLVRPEM